MVLIDFMILHSTYILLNCPISSLVDVRLQTHPPHAEHLVCEFRNDR